jgi:hypothetical protein
VPAAKSPIRYEHPEGRAERPDQEPGSFEHEPDEPAYERLPEGDRPAVVADDAQTERHLAE